MKDVDEFLEKNETLVNEFQQEYNDFIESLENYQPKGRKKAIFQYWKEAIRICEENGHKSNWEGLKLFFEVFQIPAENQITEQQYESIING